MRKLSKKISMLMVLAMLVSLFSGVVSASAASSWSFYDRTADVAVERNATYVMEKDQYANFDLYKGEAEASTKEYKYTWYSDDASVVKVDSTNGRLRAQKDAEAGEKAFVYVLIDNKATEKNENAKRGFYIQIAEEVKEVEYAIVSDIADEAYLTGEKYELAAKVTADGEAIEADVVFTLDGVAIKEFAPAKAGEYTIVATATIDDEVVATAKFVVTVEEPTTEFVKVTQKTLNTVVLTLNNEADAKKLAENVALLTAEYYVNDLTVPTPVKSVATVKDDAKSVEVVLYNNIGNGLKHTFFYGDAKISLMGTPSTPVKIEVIGAAYEYQTEKDLVVKVFNAQGVDITADIDLASRLSWEADATEDFYVAAGKIFFYNENKTAKVTAVLDMGLNDNYEEIQDLKATGYYTSVKTADVRYAPHGYQAVANNVATAPTSNYSTNAIKLAVGDAGKNVAITYKYKANVNYPADRFIYLGEDSVDANLDYTYYSSNKSVVMVDPDYGTMTAVAPGSTTIYVKCKNLINNSEITICTIPVTVYAKRALTTFSVRLDGNNKLSVQNGATAVAPINFVVTAKDQLGDDYKESLTFRYEITYPTAIKANSLGAYLDDNVNLTNNKITIDQGTGLQAYLGTLTKAYETIKVKIVGIDTGNNDKEFNAGEFTILARNVAGVATQSRELGFSQTSVDMKLNKDNLGSYVSNLTLAKKDNQGFYLGDENISVVTTNVNAQVVSGSGYWVVLKKDGQVLNVDGTKLVASANKIAYNTVYDVDGTAGGEVKKMDKGVYSAELYVFNSTTGKPQYLGQRTLTLADTTEAYTVKLIKDKIDVASLGEIKNAIEFYRGGNKIDNNKITDLVWIDFKNDGNHTYVTSLCVKIATDEMNWKFGGTYTEQMFNVNALFDTK